MADYSRREFLKKVGAVAGLFLAGRSVFPLVLENTGDFEILVVGDSLISGQGLKEEHKFYNLTREWLQREVFGDSRKVNLNVKAHSGARIYLHEDELKALEDAEKETDKFYYPEVNISFPDIKTQIDLASREYERAEAVDLIMLTGGITNIDVSEIINPFESNKKLRRDIKKYCNQMMFEFLDHTAKVYPNALITVIGYYPMVSPKSKTSEIFNTILELYKAPRPFKPVANNVLTRQFIKPLHKKMTKRSRIWAAESNREFQTAVDRLNAKFEKRRAIFVKSPITEDTCYGTENSLLWQMAKKGRSEDEVYDRRKTECREVIESLKDVRQRYRIRFCELAGIGHPNIEGSKAYAEAIKTILKPVLQKSRQTI